MTGRTPKLKVRDDAMASLAAKGMTSQQIADALHVNPQAVRLWAKMADAKLPRRNDPASKARADKMVAMFRQGVILAKIGAQFGVTRERVRQILCKQGVGASEGGVSKRAEVKRLQRESRKEAYWLAMYGLPYAIVRQLQADGVTRAFQEQKRNAFNRGIPFNLSFQEWFAVWQTSGKLDQRGRGKGKYVMSRINDEGAYEVGNVHIQTSIENNREGIQKVRTRPRRESTGVYMLYPGSGKPWVANVGKKRLGRFGSEGDAAGARAAYLAANPDALRKIDGRGYAHIKATARSSERFQVMVGKKYVGTYKTAEDALAARAEYMASLPSKEPSHA